MKEKVNKVLDQMNKFSFAQMTSNSSGKTSSSGTMGCLIIVVGCVGFLTGCVDFMVSDKAEIMMYSTGLVGTGAALLGYRKSKEGTSLNLNVDESGQK